MCRRYRPFSFRVAGFDPRCGSMYVSSCTSALFSWYSFVWLGAAMLPSSIIASLLRYLLGGAQVHVEEQVVPHLLVHARDVRSLVFMPSAFSISMRSMPFDTVGKSTVYMPYSSRVMLHLALKLTTVEKTLLTTSPLLFLSRYYPVRREILYADKHPLRALYYEISSRVIRILALALLAARASCSFV